MKILESDNYSIKIYMAGNIDVAKQVCRNFCVSNNLCINIYQADYIYRCGEESGFCIEIINYPKYPETIDALFSMSKVLATELLSLCCQRSCTIINGSVAYYFNREDEFER